MFFSTLFTKKCNRNDWLLDLILEKNKWQGVLGVKYYNSSFHLNVHKYTWLKGSEILHFYWVRFCLDSAYPILSLSFKISKNIPGPNIFGVPLYCKLYMCQISFWGVWNIMHKNFCVAVPFVNKTVQNPILNIQFAS